MLFYSITGASMILLCGIELSRRLNRSAKQILDEADRYIVLLRYIRSQIDCFALPINEILKRADSALLKGCGWADGPPPTSLHILFNSSEIKDEKIKSVLTEFSEDFGKSYLEDQLRRCDHFLSLLEERRNIIAKELPSKKKLNSTLCISGALALIILLI